MMTIETTRSATTTDNGRAIIARESEAEESHIKRGRAFDEMQKYPEAIASFNNALKANPQSVRAYIGLGMVYRKMERYPEALASFNSVLKINSQDGYGYLGRGSVYLATKQYDQAKSDWQKAAQLYQQQGDTSGYKTTIKLLQQLEKLSQMK
jgi:tetratricopeptide (TPR) repeat protein